MLPSELPLGEGEGDNRIVAANVFGSRVRNRFSDRRSVRGLAGLGENRSDKASRIPRGPRPATARAGYMEQLTQCPSSLPPTAIGGGRTVGCCLRTYTATSISFGSTPAINSKSRSRCRSGMLARIACVAIRQSFADRGVTPAHRHRAYKCAALRAASRGSGAITIGNSPSTRSQRVNRSGLSAPWRTSCRMGGASQTGSARSRASKRSATSTRLSPRRYAIHTEESTSMLRHRGGLTALGS